MDKFPEDEWLSKLILEEDRALYRNMTPGQKHLLRLAYYYGAQKVKEKWLKTPWHEVGKV